MAVKYVFGVDLDLGTSYLDNYGTGNDTVYVMQGFNRISTRAGNDLIDARQHQGSDGLHAYAGLGNDIVYGDETNDLGADGDGNDFVDLYDGHDVMSADRGNDTYIGGDGYDTIEFFHIDTIAQGISTLNYTGVTVDLAKTAAQNIGIFGLDTISGFENLKGSLGNDVLYGDNGENHIWGMAGSDTINGRGGNDVLYGDDPGEIFAVDGADRVIGGSGRDQIYLTERTAHRDIADFNALAESGVTSSTADVIHDFDRGGRANDDKIDLSSIDANPYLAGNQPFKFIGGKAFGSHVGEVRLAVVDGDTHVLIDADRDGAAEMRIIVEDVTGLNASDFVL